MGSARQDYVRFLRWLHEPQQGADERVKRFANMVLADFDGIAATSRQRNARSASLARSARLCLATTPAALPNADAPVAAGEWPWRRLKELKVGPFRGFRREEQFDLRKRVILFYGPNGSGKTSLCEALERGLLGSVEEAELKRIDERRYLANIHVGRFVEPRLIATTADGNDVQVTADADIHRFCFIEKNRIDSFSRLAARPPAQRTELIAALFGMDKFNDFAGHFNEQMDAELTLQGDKQATLRLKREAVARDQVTVRDEAQALARHDEEDAAYAEGYASDTTYVQLKEIIGTQAEPGRLHELNQLLDAVPAAVVGLTRQTFMCAYEEINESAGELRKITQDLTQRSSQVSFMDLYSAVTALQASEDDHCPACDTPLDRVARDPYEKARIGLDELRDLAEMQERQKARAQSLDESSRVLRDYLNQILSLFGRARSNAGRGGSIPRPPTQAAAW